MHNEDCETRMRWKSLLIAIAVVASIMAINTHGIAFADPKHCDRPGWPSCFSVGKSASDGTSCPKGHSKNFCSGFESSGSSSSSTQQDAQAERNRQICIALDCHQGSSQAQSSGQSNSP